MNKNSAVSAYYRELERLPATIEFASKIPIGPLADFLSSHASKPLMAVGSGGSFTAATLAATLHESVTHRVGKANTPYQSLAIQSLLDAGALLISAGGHNPDAVAAFRGLTRRATGGLAVLTGSPDSRLADLASNTDGTELFSFKLPFGRDGFLATNSLVATSVLLARAYGSFPRSSRLSNMALGKVPAWRANFQTVKLLQEALSRETSIVLAGSWTWPAAVDLESKFSEAGLAHVQIVDYRNFAHGRHFWLAKRADSTTVVALSSPDTEELVARTLATLPTDVKSVTLRTELPGATGSIDLLCQGMFAVGLAAEQLQARLNRPGVPPFGRRLYRSGFKRPEQSVSENWVARKVMAIGFSSRDVLEKAEQSLTGFLEELDKAQFEALVTDYDGTINRASSIEGIPPKEVQKELVRLLNGGLILGVATGRGNSVVRALRQFLPQPLWKQVIVGCYGGASTSSLADTKEEPLIQDESLPYAERHLRSKLAVFDLEYDLNPQLLSIRPGRPADMSNLCNLISETLAEHVSSHRIVESSHSVDILGASASKLRVVDSVIQHTRTKDPARVLRIGDQGAWRGNDYELLASGLSLSVDRVSGDLSTCWNISSPNRRLELAATQYLRALKKDGRSFRYKVTRPEA